MEYHQGDLLYAANQGNFQKVRTYLEQGLAQVDEKGYDDRTALHIAAAGGYFEVVKVLLSFKAKICVDRWNRTPINDALEGDHVNIMTYLHAHYNQTDSLPNSKSNHYYSSKVNMTDLLQRGDVELWALKQSEFELGETFDKGAGGEIVKCRFRGQLCAAKVLAKTQTEKETLQFLTDIKNEINILSVVRHRHIVQFYGACLSLPCILLEYCANGNLETRLTQVASGEKRITAQQKYQYAYQIALAVNYLHLFPVPICHRDLKPSNILLTAFDQIKLADFGLAKFLKPSTDEEEFKMTGETGSYRYMAPEVFQHLQYGTPVDVYSYGMILYWIFSGSRPFYPATGEDAARKAVKQIRPDLSPIREADVKELILTTWNHDPEQRPKFSSILQKLEDVSFTSKPLLEKLMSFSFNDVRRRSSTTSSLTQDELFGSPVATRSKHRLFSLG